MTKSEIISAVRELPASQQCEIVRELVAEHVQTHGAEIIEKYAPNKGWIKAAWAGVGAVISAALALACSSCTITPRQAAQLQTLDGLLHEYAPCVITIEPLEK